MAQNWTDIADGDVDPDSPVTTGLMQALRDNPEGLAAGVAGAPRVQTAGIADGAVTNPKMASSAVGRTELKTTTGDVSASSFSQGDREVNYAALPGGEYGFVPRAKMNATGTGGRVGAALTGVINDGDGASTFDIVLDDVGDPWTTSFVTYETVVAERTIGNNVTVTVRQRYVQSSPPYDHGDGPVMGYVYVIVDNDGNVTGTYIAPDPPWYGNTSQNPTEQFVGDDGKEYARFVRPRHTMDDLKQGRVTAREFAGGMEEHVEEITTALKLRGMDELPAPFRPRQDRHVVLIDPMDESIQDLLALNTAGGAASELFGDGYLRCDNREITRAGPPGVPIHAMKWSNAK